MELVVAAMELAVLVEAATVVAGWEAVGWVEAVAV